MTVQARVHAKLEHLSLVKDQQTKETRESPGPHAFVRLQFFYDPYLVAQVKGLAVRYFLPASKTWVVPYSIDAWKQIVNKFGNLIEPEGELATLVRLDEERMTESALIKQAGDATVKGYEYSTEPYAHQRMGHALLDKNDRFALLWEPGTGKTKAIIDDLCHRKETGRLKGPALVFCPNFVKHLGWGEQVPLHSGGRLTVEVLDGSTVKRKQLLRQSKADVLVMNHESTLYLKDELTKPTRFSQWPYVVFDEATAYKNPQSQRTKVAFKLPMQVTRILTGTPITNSPVDAYAPYTIMDPRIFGSWWHYKSEYLTYGGYGGYEIVGYKHLDQLQEKIMRVSSRVLKKDVLDLPEKTYNDYEVVLEGPVLKHYEQMRDQLRTWWGNQVIGGTVNAKLAITQLLRLAQISGGLLQEGDETYWVPDSPKLKALEWILSEELPKTDKVVVFCVYRKEIEELARHFAGLNPVVLMGGFTDAQRTEAVHRFQDRASDTRLLVAQVHSGGIGIDLYAAQTVVYYTRNFSLEDYLQSQDRLHRIGQTGTVNVIHLIGKIPGAKKRTIDEIIAKRLKLKQTLADAVTGDRVVKIQEIEALAEEVLAA